MSEIDKEIEKTITNKNVHQWFFLLFGSLMISHFIYLVFRCIYADEIENIFWISHIGTLIGGLGAILRNRLLISTALVALAGHHGFWLLDTVTWLITGEFPFGTTSYLLNANIYEWLQSSNHFFTVPMLFLLAIFQGGIKKNSWIWASLLFIALAILSFFISPVQSNVNSVHQLWPGLDKSFLRVINQLHPFPYFITIISISIVGNYIPAYLILNLIFILLRKLRKWTF